MFCSCTKCQRGLLNSGYILHSLTRLKFLFATPIFHVLPKTKTCQHTITSDPRGLRPHIGHMDEVPISGMRSFEKSASFQVKMTYRFIWCYVII